MRTRKGKNEMHNSPLKNAEFALAFTETNLRWLLGEEPPNEEKIAACKAQIEARKKEIEELSK